MKKISTLLALVFCLNAKAQTYVTIPDANFVTYLQSIIPGAMNGNQMDVSSPAVTTNTHSITCISRNIANLSGVQYFTSLTYLNCGGNSLTSLPTLPNSLTNLNCGSNAFTSLPVLPNSITILGCYSNSLTNIPVLPTSTQTLYCGGDSLTSIPTLPSTLIYLDCGSSGSLTAYPTLPNSLVYFHCNFNSLPTLPALPSSLQELWCNSSSLTSLPALPNSIQAISCEGNSLTTLPTLPNSLKILYCDHNNISCFPTFPSSLTTLVLDPNPYNCLPNYVSAMSSPDLSYPLCAAGNTHGCAAVTGIAQITSSNELKLYPNPAQTNFIIETNNTDKQTLQLFDVNGKLVLIQTINGKTNIDATNLAEGIYNLSLINTNSVVNKRLVIVR
jgi:hypothetical protein